MNNSPEQIATAVTPPRWERRDWRNLLLIVAGYAIILWLMPIGHNFAAYDDWSWTRSVEQLLAGQGFRPPEWAQMTVVFHVYWGALFAAVMGVGFSSVVASTMAMSLIGALAFYVLLRRLDFSPTLSGLGVAVLIVNPLYVTYSYSYMTEITFATMLLLSCLLYSEGLRGGSQELLWLWLGSALTALAFLTRQFAVAAPIAALIWLLYSRRLTRWRAVAIALLPTLTVIAYYIWRSGYPATVGDSLSLNALRDFTTDVAQALASRTITLLLGLPIFGLTVVLFSRVRQWWLIIFWAALIGLVIYSFQQSQTPDAAYGFLENEINATPFSLDATPIWWLGVALTAWLLAELSERAWAWRTVLLAQRPPALTDFLYLVTIILFVGTFASSQLFRARYLLPVIFYLIIALLAPLRSWAKPRLLVVTLTLILVAGYSAMLHLDDYDYYNARWQAGSYLLAQGVAADHIDNAFAWDGYYLFDRAVQQLGSHDFNVVLFAPYKIIDRQYIVALRPQLGYHVIYQVPFLNRLTGFTSQVMYAQQRNAP